MMNMTCSFDHRVLDGAQVGSFLADVRKRPGGLGPADADRLGTLPGLRGPWLRLPRSRRTAGIQTPAPPTAWRPTHRTTSRPGHADVPLAGTRPGCDDAGPSTVERSRADADARPDRVRPLGPAPTACRRAAPGRGVGGVARPGSAEGGCRRRAGRCGCSTMTGRGRGDVPARAMAWGWRSVDGRRAGNGGSRQTGSDGIGLGRTVGLGRGRWGGSWRWCRGRPRASRGMQRSPDDRHGQPAVAGRCNPAADERGWATDGAPACGDGVADLDSVTNFIRCRRPPPLRRGLPPHGAALRRCGTRSSPLDAHRVALTGTRLANDTYRSVYLADSPRSMRPGSTFGGGQSRQRRPLPASRHRSAARPTRRPDHETRRMPRGMRRRRPVAHGSSRGERGAHQCHPTAPGARARSAPRPAAARRPRSRCPAMNGTTSPSVELACRRRRRVA